MIVVDVVDKLVDRIVQLFKYRRESKRRIFEDYIAPIYAEFKNLHEDYIKSFSEYRKLIKSSNQLNEDSEILDRVEKDNLFKAHYRIKVYELAKIARDELIGPFVDSIYNYLIDPLLYLPSKEMVFNHFDEKVPDELESVELQDLDVINSQYFRSTLSTRLEMIACERWTAIFDPNASRPPLNETEISHKQEFFLTKFNIPSNVPQRIERLKIALALKELDYLVQVMQSAYQKVEIEFNKLKQKLYLKKKA